MWVLVVFFNQIINIIAFANLHLFLALPLFLIALLNSCCLEGTYLCGPWADQLAGRSIYSLMGKNPTEKSPPSKKDF